MSSVSNGLYFLTLPLVSFMRVIYRKIRNARYTLGARYLSKNTVIGPEWVELAGSNDNGNYLADFTRVRPCL